MTVLSLFDGMSCGQIALRELGLPVSKYYASEIDRHAIATSRLTPRECCRLQTVPEWYRGECSDSQIYKMLGNGWTVAVIKHILQYL